MQMLELFHTNFAVLADFGRRLKRRRIKVTDTQDVLQVSAFRGTLLQLNLFSKKKEIYSFFYSQMGIVLFLQKKKNFKSLLTCAKMQLGKLL